MDAKFVTRMPDDEHGRTHREGRGSGHAGKGIPLGWITGRGLAGAHGNPDRATIVCVTASPDDLDGLYQVPLSDFTAARNELAKRLGREGVSVKALPKPNLAAWTVNQLYWQRRPLYDAVVAASGRRRDAHARILSGRDGDVAGAEAAHRDAMKAAMAPELDPPMPRISLRCGR